MREVFILFLFAQLLGRCWNTKIPSLLSTKGSPSGVVTPLLDNQHLLTLPFEDLTDALGGTGRARIFWNNLREGIDPSLLTSITTPDDKEDHKRKLSNKVKAMISTLMKDKPLISAFVLKESIASCGTNKLLLSLQDSYSIESVLIPSTKFQRTTLCVSTQIGCDRYVFLIFEFTRNSSHVCIIIKRVCLLYDWYNGSDPKSALT